MLDQILINTKKILPKGLFDTLQPAYHLTMAFASALWYRFPSRQIRVIAVTGTKGKSSTTEIINAILEKAGHKTALSNTIRFKIGDRTKPNMHKMSMPGRSFMQRTIRQAVSAGCKYMIVEMTSQGSLLYRHRFIDIDTLVFTNLSKEHIEAHGSYENYINAKLDIARGMVGSHKKTTLIVNIDDKEADRFMSLHVRRHLTYSIRDVEPYVIRKSGLDFTLNGRIASSPLSGIFNLYNIVAAVTVAKSEGVAPSIIAEAVKEFGDIPGRVEKILAPQGYTVVVDYAHTPDSLEKLYRVFRPDPKTRETDGHKLIAILGGTGGGRDNWKRREMGHLADMYCNAIILTDEDPYDEDPDKIVADVAAGVTDKPCIVIMDRREAIREALHMAQKGDYILITGKGTDPYIMGPNGTKTPWSDSRIVREELAKISI